MCEEIPLKSPRYKTILKLVAMAEKCIPGITKQTEDEIKKYYVDKYNLKKIRQTLTFLKQEYGREVFIKTIVWATERDFYYGNLTEMECIAKAYKVGNETILDQAYELFIKYGFRDIGHRENLHFLYRGVEHFGAEEIEQGICLTIPVSIEPPANIGLRAWFVDRETEDQKKVFAYAVCFLGLTKVTELLNFFEQSGLAEFASRQFLQEIAWDNYWGLSDKAQDRILSAIKCVQKAGVEPDIFALVVNDALKNRNGTISEIMEVLNLYKVNDINKVDFGFRDILEYYRQPTYQAFVKEAFALKTPGAVSYVHFGINLGLCFAYIEDQSLINVVARNKLDIAKQEARLRTIQLCKSRFARYGMYTQDQQNFVADLSQNRLLTIELLRYTGTYLTNPRRIISLAENRFGPIVKNVLSHADSDSELEYALALLKIGDPYLLLRTLDRLPIDCRTAFVSTVNWYGFEVAIKAYKMVIELKFEPSCYILPMARCLSTSGKKIVFLQKDDGRQIVTPEHEQQIERYLAEEPAIRKNIARMVKLFRNVEQAIYYRMVYRRVVYRV